MATPWSDIVGDFMDLTAEANSPRLFCLWAGIAMVAGALERRVWAKAGDRATYPNLYTLLVAPPGVGKQVIEEVHELWSSASEPGSREPAFKVAPDNMSKAALMDTMAKAKQVRLLPAPLPPTTYHSLLIAAEEFQVLLPNYDTEYIGSLNLIYNNPNRPYTESRRHGPVRELKIEFPQLNILAGAQPSYFVSTFPEEAWTTGFARRIIMVYSGETPFRELFTYSPDRTATHDKLRLKLSHLATLYGQMQWTPEAAEAIAKWHRDGGPPAPTHSKLQHYLRSRTMHVIKLCTVSAVSRTGRMVIEESDVIRAIAWLVEAEALMPDIFREMIGRSDQQVIEEMHYYVLAKWAKSKGQPITLGQITEFLLQRVTTDKVEKITTMAERAGILIRLAGTQDLYKPRLKNEGIGIE